MKSEIFNFIDMGGHSSRKFNQNHYNMEIKINKDKTVTIKATESEYSVLAPVIATVCDAKMRLKMTELDLSIIQDACYMFRKAIQKGEWPDRNHMLETKLNQYLNAIRYIDKGSLIRIDND